MLINGQVTRINNRTLGSRTVYSIQVNGQWYGGIWNNPPACNEGDTVSFEAEENKGYWNVVGDTLQVQSGATAPKSSGNTSVNVRTDDRQASIVYQSSRANAIALVTTALANDALPLPAKKADRFATLVDMVKELADEFAYDALNPTIMSPEERLQSDVLKEVSGDMDD